MAAGRGYLRVGRCWFWAGSTNPVQSASMTSYFMVVVSYQNCEIFIMDNVTSLPHPSQPCVITLNQFQYAFYQQSHLEIHSPDGECIAQIGEELTRIAEDDVSYQLWEQACLL